MITDSQKWFLLASLLTMSGLLYILSPVLTPFLIAALLAYLGDPLVDRLETRKCSRVIGVVVVFIVLTLFLALFLLILIPLLEVQISALIHNIPSYLEWVQVMLIPWLHDELGVNPQQLNVDVLRETLSENWRQAGGLAAILVKTASDSGLLIVAWIGNLLLIPVVAFYLLRDWDVFMGRISEFLPRSIAPVVMDLAKESDAVLASFLRGQVSVMAALGTIYSVGLWMVGLELALLVGMLAGMVSFVPYLGFIVGFGAATIAAVMQYHDLLHLVPILIVFGVGQTMEGMLLTPWLVGDRIGLHPVAVIFSVLVGGQLFGFIGVLIALPVAAIIAVLLRFAHRQYKGSQLYSTGQNLSESDRAALDLSGADLSTPNISP